MILRLTVPSLSLDQLSPPSATVNANDDAVIEKKSQLDESFKREKGKLETEVAKMRVKLNESMAKT